ncbi:hypothetical protein MP213Fo_06160 [Pseudochrobactrum sp. MP213Fo]
MVDHLRMSCQLVLGMLEHAGDNQAAMLKPMNSGWLQRVYVVQTQSTPDI